ncbi:DUF2066 domain-containing protein [Reinekea blandensis]|nr:DUF2066 domain-containing protein [Reinekea blandensis]
MGIWRSFKNVIAVVAVMAGVAVGGANAATDLDLYQESVVVSQNADRQEQNEAIAEAFSRLIVRVTGLQQSLDNEAIQEALTQGADYIATFRFDVSDQFFTNVLGEQVPTKEMVLQFDKNAVDTLLVQNRLPVWGQRRPDVLVWLADRLDGQEHILTDAEGTEVSQALLASATERGIPVVLPIGDLTDTLNLSFSELYGLFSRDIETASERYEHDAILAGRIVPAAGNDVQADWLLLFKGERLRLPTVSGSVSSVVAQGIDLVAQRLSEQYALMLDPTMIGNLSVNVLGVEKLDDFAAVENYLKSINLITRATLSRFSEDGVEFLVEVSGDRSQLIDVLALDDRLLPVTETTLNAQLDNRLVYRWQSN